MKRIIKPLATLVGLLIVAFGFSYMSVVFGWTNPSQNPPGGSGILTAFNGNLGINMATPSTAKLVITSPGIPAIDVAGVGPLNDIVGLPPVPAGPTAAASKAYVDAQSSGGGGKPVITVWGVSAAPSPWSQWTAVVNQTLHNCLLGGGNACTLGVLTGAAPAAGTGVSCPANWTEVLSGYGPYAYLIKQYAYSSVPNSVNIRSSPQIPADWTDIPSHDAAYNPVAVTYSICGKNAYEVGQTDVTVWVSPGDVKPPAIGAAAGVLTACIPQNNGVIICNTCKVCQAP